MACVNFRILTNPTQHYKPMYDAIQIGVPCGKCEGCRRDQRDEWFIRSYYEWLNAKSKGGYTLFTTLTYSEDCIPFIDDRTSFDLHEYCFDYNHIRTLIHSLRKSIKSTFGISENAFTYLVTSEYGGRNTHRSHYHPLFHIYDKRIPASWFLARLHELWSLGHVYPSRFRVSEALVDSFHGEKYVSKYICKDLNFFDKPNIKDLLFPNGKLSKTVKDELSHYLPRHYQSKGYGGLLLEQIKNAPDCFKFIKDGIRPLQQQMVYRVPRYILNRLSYNYTVKRDVYGNIEYDDNGRPRLYRYLNEFGKRFRIWKKENNINEFASRLSHQLSTIGLRSKLSDSDIKYLFHDDNASVVWLSDQINRLRGDSTFHDVALYKMCLKGREFVDHGLFDFCSTSNDVYNYILQQDYDYAEIDHATLPCSEIPPGYSQRKLLFDDLPQYKNYNALLQIYEKVRNYSTKKELERLRLEEIKNRRLRYLFKPH